MTSAIWIREPGAGPRVGPKVSILDDAMLRFLVKVFFPVLLRCTSIMLVYLVR